MDRIKFSTNGLYVSKTDKSTDSGSLEDFVFHPDQVSMAVVAQGELSFGGSGTQWISFNNPSQLIPYITLKGSDGVTAFHSTFCAIATPPWNNARIVVRDGVARTVTYTVFV